MLTILLPMETDDRSSTSMNVSLPKSLRSFVDERVSSSSYTSASEYVRELIRKDRERQAAHDRLEELLLEGLASGPASEWTEDDWASIRERVARRLEEKKDSQ
jgi:antitoxin ParD1/3/4